MCFQAVACMFFLSDYFTKLIQIAVCAKEIVLFIMVEACARMLESLEQGLRNVKKSASEMLEKSQSFLQNTFSDV